jgi:hypothetical protein
MPLSLVLTGPRNRSTVPIVVGRILDTGLFRTVLR